MAWRASLYKAESQQLAILLNGEEETGEHIPPRVVAGTVNVSDNDGTLTVDGAVQFVDESGATYGVKHINNKIRTSSMPYLYDIAEGNVAGHSHFEKFGVNGDVDNAREVVWDVGGMYTFPSGTMQMEVVSSGTADTATGTGVRSVYISYLDGSYAAQAETVTLNGTAPVTTTATNILRVNGMRAASVGSGGVAAGNIDIRHLTDTPIYARISTGNTMARSSVCTVPGDKTIYVTSVAVTSVSKTASYSVFTMYAKYDHATDTPLDYFAPLFEIGLQDDTVIRNFEIPIRFPGSVDVYMAVIADASNSNVYAACASRGWME